MFIDADDTVDGGLQKRVHARVASHRDRRIQEESTHWHFVTLMTPKTRRTSVAISLLSTYGGCAAILPKCAQGMHGRSAQYRLRLFFRPDILCRADRAALPQRC